MSACAAERLRKCREIALLREKVEHYEQVFGRDHPVTQQFQGLLLEAQEALLALPECGE